MIFFVCYCYNRHTLTTILPWYVGTCQERILDEVTFHTLISSLAAWHEEFAHADFCDLVFDQFLLLLVSNLSVLRHTLRLLWYVLPKMDPQKVVHILTITQPSSEVGSTAQLHVTIETLKGKYHTNDVISKPKNVCLSTETKRNCLVLLEIITPVQ